jgi:bifunctional DNA-binding transcriptional regulator/antitoxin component of YhaV-PrlF toxin-antitoxin module
MTEIGKILDSRIITFNDERGRIRIPQKFLRRINLQQGDGVEIQVREGGFITLKPALQKGFKCTFCGGFTEFLHEGVPVCRTCREILSPK